MLLFLTIQVLALAAIIAEFQIDHNESSSVECGLLNINLLVNSGPFWMVVGGICMVLMPLCGLVLMTQEIEAGNHELLLLTQLNRWKVVWGKFVSLWGISVITFISLMPYVVVRYLVGGVEWWHEVACGAAVLGGSAMIGAGAIGASAFRGTGARIGVFCLFICSMLVGCIGPLLSSAAVTGGCGIFYHITALSAVVCYSIMGLAIARSQLRLAVMTYEVKPGGMMIGVLIFSPFLIGLITAMTCGFGGFAALLAVSYIATTIDSSAKSPPVKYEF